MTTWAVQNRVTGEVVYIYTADAPYPWDGMGFDICNHIEVVDAPPTLPPRKVSKLEFMNLLTDEELVGIYAAAKVSPAVEVWLAKFHATSVEPDGTSIDKDDPRTIAGLEALEAVGLISTGRAAEVLA